MPEHSRQIETCLPEKFTSGRDRETHQGEGGGGKTHKGEGQRNSNGEGRRKAQGSYEKMLKKMCDTTNRISPIIYRY